MSASSCHFLVTAHIGAPNPQRGAIGDEQLTNTSILRSLESSETSRFQFPMSSPQTQKLSESRRTSTQSQLANFFVESQYLQSVSQRDQSAGHYAPWKSGFSQTNRRLWTETLTLAVRDLLVSETDLGAGPFIDDEGIHRYAELVEWAIFEYGARDPVEYGNEMAAKYDAIRGGDFSKEESKLLHHYAWL